MIESWRLFFTALFVSLCTTANAQDAWAILPDQASCIIENLPKYLDSGKQPIVIVVSVCPVVDRVEAMRKMQQNSGLPRVTVAADGTSLDELIVYSREEIECLSRLQIDLVASPVMLPKTPCVP